MTDAEVDIKERLEYLRQEIRAERISMSELAELANLADHIGDGDVELREWAGVPEFPESNGWVYYTTRIGVEIRAGEVWRVEILDELLVPVEGNDPDLQRIADEDDDWPEWSF